MDSIYYLGRKVSALPNKNLLGKRDNLYRCKDIQWIVVSSERQNWLGIAGFPRNLYK
jgi:hypothetical protein